MRPSGETLSIFEKRRFQDAVLCKDSRELLTNINANQAQIEFQGSWSELNSPGTISSWGNLKGLSLADCRLTADNLIVLAKCLPPNLTLFGISSNPCEDLEAWRSLWRALPRSLTELDLGLNKLSDPGLFAFCKDYLAVSGSILRDLRLDGNKFRTLTPLGSAIGAMSKLQSLDLSDNAITDGGLLPLTEALPESCLRCVKLGGNVRICRSANGLFGILPQVPSLEALHLEATAIGDEELETLWRCLGSCHLQELNLEGTWVTDDGVSQLVAAIPGSSLRTLHLTAGELSQEMVDEASRILQAQSLNSSLNTIGVANHCQSVAGPLLPKSHASPSATSGPARTVATALAAPKSSQIRAHLQNFGYGRATHYQDSVDLKDELEHITSLPKHNIWMPKTRLVRLLTEEERKPLLENLNEKLQEVQSEYQSVLDSKKKDKAWQERAHELYEPEIEHIQKSIAYLGSTYIFIDCEA